MKNDGSINLGIKPPTPLVYKIVREYDPDDKKFQGDAYCVSLLLDGQFLILTGDFYHNHIEDRIKGYLLAVKDITGVEPRVFEENKASEAY